MSRALVGLPPRPKLAIFPPHLDTAFVMYVATVGRMWRAQHPEVAVSYWRARRTYVRKVLAGRGWEPDAIEAAIQAFYGAVRAEAQRQAAEGDEVTS